MTATTWFLGTPEAAVPSLEALAGTTAVDLVVTRPDRPRGRGRMPSPSPVADAATRLGLEVARPASRRELAALLGERGQVDVAVVVAFGMIIPPETLALPRQGFLNVHFSLLPRWRGAAPVARAIMAGDTVTGVTIMVMDEGLDTGPVLASASHPITADITGGALTGALADLGAWVLVETLPSWLAGMDPRPQDAAGVTYAERLEPADRLVPPTSTVREAIDRVRALAPEPGAQLMVDGALHKVLQLRPGVSEAGPGEWAERDGTPEFGLVDGPVAVVTIQPPGKRPMPGDAWLRGRALPED